MPKPVVLQVQGLQLVDPCADPLLARVVLNPKIQVNPSVGELHAAGILPLEEARLLYPLGAEHELALIPTDGTSAPEERRDV